MLVSVWQSGGQHTTNPEDDNAVHSLFLQDGICNRYQAKQEMTGGPAIPCSRSRL